MFAETSNPYEFKYLVTGISGEGIKQVYLPPVPEDESKIYFKKEQKWTCPVMEPELADQLAEWIAKSDPDSKEYDPVFVPSRVKEIIEWENWHWLITEEGMWFWNNGVPTYLTPFYTFYLTAWNTYFGRPEYRETDKEITYWVAWWEENPNMFGGVLNTIRRYGKSAMMGAWLVFRTIRNAMHFSGMQGESDDKVFEFYATHVLDPMKKLPGYFLPEYDDDGKNMNGVKFKKTQRRTERKREFLGSVVDYRPSKEQSYDQAALHSYVGEELGKCHPKGTKIRMFDGSVKNVEDVVIGDELRGTDNIPRTVLNNGFGRGKIFKIIPNSKTKAKPWYVNEHHILSCKLSGGNAFKGYKRGDILNLTVKDYLSISEKKRKHLMCYRVGVEYPESKHKIHPYFLGLWLGDGSHIAAEIASIEPEIAEWLCKNYDVTKKKKGPNRIQIYYVKGLRSTLISENLFRNKHIPNSYLIDSRHNRLQLLAGLIDTDGYRGNQRANQRHYEITQKRKWLAESIQELCMSLGFYCSLNSKVATMKRKDGTMYRSIVYRMHIFGTNLHEIPCRVERKKMPANITTYNSKDPSVYGFNVEYDRIDDYYGFNISGNRLYLLEDYTVTHNTLMSNVHERWKFVKPCLARGIYIRGKHFGATTVEFMDAKGRGGKAYQKLFHESDIDNLQPNGRTVSGLCIAFLPGDCALEGYFDEWGHPIRDKAKEWILMERKSVEANPKDLSDLIRKYPLYIYEIFFINTDRCEFNSTILQNRRQVLISSKVPTFDRYELYWEDNKRFTKLRIRHNPKGGWLKATWLPQDLEKMTNLVDQRYINGKKEFVPKNDGKFAIGLDPIEHGVTIEDKTMIGGEDFVAARRSRPVLLVKRKFDSAIDGLIDTQEEFEARAKPGMMVDGVWKLDPNGAPYDYKTNVYVMMMDTRPNDPNVLFERVLMICWWLGCSIHVESQKPAVISYFQDNNCGNFILKKYQPVSRGSYSTSAFSDDGTPASPLTIQDYTGAIATDVEYFGHTYPFVELVDDLLLFNPKKTTEYDYAVAMGFCELACKMRPKVKARDMIDLDQFLTPYR